MRPCSTCGAPSRTPPAPPGSPGRCPECGAEPPASMVPIYAALSALAFAFLVAIGAAAWSRPAGPWLVGIAIAGLAACGAAIARSRPRRS